MKNFLKIAAGLCVVAAVCVGIGLMRREGAKEPDGLHIFYYEV